MKKCTNCGYENSEESNFCENCGSRLSQVTQQPAQPQQPQQQQPAAPQPAPQWQPEPPMQQPKQNSNKIVVAVCIVLGVAIVAIVGLLFWKSQKAEEKPQNLQSNTASAGMLSGEEEQAGTEKTDTKEAATTEKADESETDESETDAQESDTEEADTAVDYTDVDVNGVDNVYVTLIGTTKWVNDQAVLVLEDSVTLCGYNPQDEIEKLSDVTKIELIDEKDALSDSMNQTVTIKGKLSITSKSDPQLQVVKVTADKKEAAEQADTEGHTYQIMVEDVTWQEAFDACQRMGGYLVHIDSAEEFHTITQQIVKENKEEVHFYLGGRRDLNATNYYWVDENNQLEGDVLNPDLSTWTSGFWMENEPSYVSEDVQEMYMNLINFKDKWVLNDVLEDITAYYPGKTGYICEFDPE